MGDYPQKSLESIDIEIKRIDKEKERREAELRSKKAGGEIESFEIERKRKIIESIIARITLNVKTIRELFSELSLKTDQVSHKLEKKCSQEELTHIKKIFSNSNSIAMDCFKAYVSIKKDLENTFKEGRINDLFPTIEINCIEDNNHLFDFDIDSFFSILRQELDLLEYLNRFR